ncbi:DUF937 domain-containing protein [Rhizobium ruizarguesonis]|jgi:hypothetical protein|uniref:DUF937 domain-containing protein n=1 Tax=Rhizobium ruizarguesonis TaxID=2081791 RepID=A0AAE8U0Z4_9HYPH|nr:DUF937 domain-containing protein [Rhizobium ruizarguesonis]MBY5829814.1 DUF937 domain-containing protein [Rhizobium leguminosarum]NKK60366.1 DUF937 domain-containing protein [Rhizobium leguminosarum bv. viciae]QIO44857.1 DUF937 domain-containing protein [Rhizobium leguminosarum bv. trifolii]QJS26249.1 DUF937 domain-containing protein [Rhizobium leguminosarum bv. trifolii TA1]MBY5858844.1 DUF937 domain-containing protein [Rhizobium leguminosarum]
MLPLFDMMMQAQNGAAMEAIARQFNLAQEQATKAMAALMPAFSAGLKRSTSNPYDFVGLMQAVSSGNYARYFEDMSRAFTPEGISDGNNILAQLFGSKEVSRAVAAQAAQMTGIGQDIYKQMLPVLADTLMGGLFKQTTGQMASPVNPFVNTAMGETIQKWLESTGFAPKPKTAPEPSIFDNPFTQAMQLMFSVPKSESTPTQNPFLDNPFAKAFQEMMGGLGQQPAAKTPEAPKEEAKVNADSYTEMLNTMFDSGLEVQKNYQRNLEAIFETYRPKPSSKTSE